MESATRSSATARTIKASCLWCAGSPMSDRSGKERLMADSDFDLDTFRRQAIAVQESLNQDTYWVDVRGRRLAIRDMSVGYKANCLAFMRRRVSYFAARYVWG